MKNILIGGTHGLGAEIARELQDKGESTFIVGRTYDESKHGEGLRIDLSQTQDAAKLAKQIEVMNDSAFNFYWIAGYGYVGDFDKQPHPDVMAAVNFGNVLPAAQVAFRLMVKNTHTGHFVVVSSTTGYKARNNEAVYAGTKHAQVGFVRSLGLESERLGEKVKVCLIMPGGMKTPFWEGEEPPGYEDYLNPNKVAKHVLELVNSQDDTYFEKVIERGSL